MGSDQAIDVATTDGERRLSLHPTNPSCRGDADCHNQGLWNFGCSDQSRFCVRYGGGYEGERCSDYTHCKSHRYSGNYPSEGVCQRRLKRNGESCNWNSECRSGLCQSNDATLFSTTTDDDRRRQRWSNKICVRNSFPITIGGRRLAEEVL